MSAEPCRCRECLDGDALPDRLQGWPGATQFRLFPARSVAEPTTYDIGGWADPECESEVGPYNRRAGATDMKSLTGPRYSGKAAR